MCTSHSREGCAQLPALGISAGKPLLLGGLTARSSTPASRSGRRQRVQVHGGQSRQAGEMKYVFIKRQESRREARSKEAPRLCSVASRGCHGGAAPTGSKGWHFCAKRPSWLQAWPPHRILHRPGRGQRSRGRLKKGLQGAPPFPPLVLLAGPKGEGRSSWGGKLEIRGRWGGGTRP